MNKVQREPDKQGEQPKRLKKVIKYVAAAGAVYGFIAAIAWIFMSAPSMLDAVVVTALLIGSILYLAQVYKYHKEQKPDDEGKK